MKPGGLPSSPPRPGTLATDPLPQCRRPELGEPPPARGEHHAAGPLGFAGVPENEPAHLALRQAIEGLPSDIRRKLWAVMRTGSGDYARGDWDQAMAAADNMSEANIVGDLADEVDLHDKLMKSLYEIGVADLPSPPP